MDVNKVLYKAGFALESFCYVHEKLDSNTTLWKTFRPENATEVGAVLPYMGYIGMCSLKRYVFSAVLVINRVSILAEVVM